jgi:hypothetical protein
MGAEVGGYIFSPLDFLEIKIIETGKKHTY